MFVFVFIVIPTLTPNIPWFRLDTLIRLKRYRWAKAVRQLPIVLPLRRRHQDPFWPFRRGSCDRDYKGGGWAGGREERGGVDAFVLSPISLAKIFYMWDQDGVVLA